jgi:hypothetical protein
MTARHRWFWLGCIVLVLVGFAGADPASAGCTASRNCNNACSLSFLCPGGAWVLACSAPSQVKQCLGATSCLVGSNYVECDGNRTYCSAAPQCTKTTSTATCGGTTYSCASCTPGAPGCFYPP